MQKYLIRNIQVVNEGRIQAMDVLLAGERIEKVGQNISVPHAVTEINGEGKFLLPGAIDDQVHFREPGLTHKATIASESRAAVAGGVTSFMEMPNTQPPTFTHELLEEKYAIGAATSLANYSFYMGTSNDNVDEVLRTNDRKKEVCGVKIFMGSSTGNLLVDNYLTLGRIFSESELLIATHCEEESIIKANLEKLKQEKEFLEPSDHPVIRNEAACFESSFKAIQLAKKHNTRLHILHISTEEELRLFTNLIPLKEKRITAEVCVHHLHFTASDYARLGNEIKCNPAIKAPHHREALWPALLDDRLDVIATDHAPHLWSEKGRPLKPPSRPSPGGGKATNAQSSLVEEATIKSGSLQGGQSGLGSSPVGRTGTVGAKLGEGAGDYEKAHAGLPLVQHSVLLMLKYYKEGAIDLSTVVRKMSHAVADCFQIKDRGYIREGYYADLVIVDFEKHTVVSKENILYKCGWSPLEGETFPARITHTFVNGALVYENGRIIESQKGMRLSFDR